MDRRWFRSAALGLAAMAGGTAAMGRAADVPTAKASPPRIQTRDQALAQDAGEYATAFGLTLEGAIRHLMAQDETLATTDAIARDFADRLAGIAVAPEPDFAIDVLLTGDAPVPDRFVTAAGSVVLIRFHTGAAATRARMAEAIRLHQADIRASLLRPPAFGIDQRTGTIVAVVGDSDIAREGVEPLRARLAAMLGAPVRLRTVERPSVDASVDASVEGGARVVGIDPADGRRYACTTGFVVTDGRQTGIATAAHCPDMLDYVDGDGARQPLAFVGQWGWGYQDVQVNVSAEPLAPLFFADTRKTVARAVTGARSLAGTRAGDYVCHRGERTGYSCAVVELTDFAPAGDLCGGACLPSWVTVAGPDCRAGDSGAPVFSGTRAYGIVKGGSYRRDGSCAFYFYMSTDYLPTGWALLAAPPSALPSAPPVIPVAPPVMTIAPSVETGQRQAGQP